MAGNDATKGRGGTPQSADAAGLVLARRAHRLAVATALFAIPLVLFGGSVTTLGAGLAVEGWLVAEGHFMLFLPIDTWIDDTHRFVEHVHRLFGTGVGLLAIGAMVCAWLAARRGRRTRASAGLATAALLAVCVQGILGGERVELFSDRLAFLHGVLAQAVLATLFTSALVLSARFQGSRGTPRSSAPFGFALFALVATFVQIVLGAAYRHALRPSPEGAVGALLQAHLVGAAVAGFSVLVLARRLQAAAADSNAAPLTREVLGASARKLFWLLGIQLGLGLVAWLGYRPDAIAPLEWGSSVAHVLCGGLLLAQLVACAVWCARLGSGAWHADALARAGGAA